MSIVSIDSSPAAVYEAEVKLFRHHMETRLAEVQKSRGGILLVSTGRRDEEFETLAMIVENFHDDELPLIAALVCDSRASHRYLLVLAKPVKDPKVIAELSAAITDTVFDELDGHNGVFVQDIYGMVLHVAPGGWTFDPIDQGHPGTGPLAQPRKSIVDICERDQRK